MVICIDLDGVLNKYNKYVKGEMPDPADGVEEFLKELQKFKQPLVIHTARPADEVEPWLVEHGLDKYIRKVTNVKIPAIIYIDDRG